MPPLVFSAACLFSIVACLWGAVSNYDGFNSHTSPTNPKSLTFHLVQDHSSHIERNQLRFNVHDRNGDLYASPTLYTRRMTVYKPKSINQFMHARWSSLRDEVNEPVEWVKTEVVGPDIENRHTLQHLAKMSGNAYALPGQKNWYELDGVWNTSYPFGWEDTADGFRGHVFASSDNSTIILSIKGTTLQGPTSKKDKFNDNLLFSCCCAMVDLSWVFSTVCDCYQLGWRCDNACLSKALVEESLFYSIGINLYNNLTRIYPDANIWLTGHSLGGALAALLGSTFGIPAVAFESPGERLAASRLHLPIPILSPITHVYHNADPIPQGTCTGVGSLCAEAGYALETGCHLGRKIVYDTIGEYGWRVDVKKHVIKEVINKVLADEREWEPGREVPRAVNEDEECIDCYKWTFGDFKKDKDKKEKLVY